VIAISTLFSGFHEIRKSSAFTEEGADETGTAVSPCQSNIIGNRIYTRPFPLFHDNFLNVDKLFISIENYRTENTSNRSCLYNHFQIIIGRSFGG